MADQVQGLSKAEIRARLKGALEQARRTIEDVQKAEAEALAKTTPPDVSEKTVHKLKDEYGHDPAGKRKAFATAWKIHDQMKSEGLSKAEAEKTVRCHTCGQTVGVDAKGLVKAHQARHATGGAEDCSGSGKEGKSFPEAKPAKVSKESPGSGGDPKTMKKSEALAKADLWKPEGASTTAPALKSPKGIRGVPADKVPAPKPMGKAELAKADHGYVAKRPGGPCKSCGEAQGHSYHGRKAPQGGTKPATGGMAAGSRQVPNHQLPQVIAEVHKGEVGDMQMAESKEGLPLAGKKIPPPLPAPKAPTSAFASVPDARPKLKLPGLTPKLPKGVAPGTHPEVASSLAGLPRAAKAEKMPLPGLTPPKLPKLPKAGPTTAGKANAEIKGFKSIASNPTAMPHGGQLVGQTTHRMMSAFGKSEPKKAPDSDKKHLFSPGDRPAPGQHPKFAPCRHCGEGISHENHGPKSEPKKIEKSEGLCKTCNKPLAKCMGHK